MDLLQEYIGSANATSAGWLDPNFNLVMILGRNGVHIGGIYAAMVLVLYTASVALTTLCLRELGDFIKEKKKRKYGALCVERQEMMAADPAVVSDLINSKISA